MSKYVMVIDQEATAISVQVYNKHFQIVKTDYVNFIEHTSSAGNIQYDPVEIYEKVVEVCKRVLNSSGVSAQDILTIGITNDSKACIVWNKNTGVPYSMILESTEDSTYAENTLRWYMENIPKIKDAIYEGTALIGTMDTWLIWNLTGRAEYIISSSNAANMECFSIAEESWDFNTLDSLQIPFSILPEVHSDCGEFGTTYEKLFGNKIPITAAIVHQTGKVFAQECRLQGMAVISLKDTCIYIHKGYEVGNLEAIGKTAIGWQIEEDTTYVLQIGGTPIQCIVDFMDESGASLTEYNKINAEKQAMNNSPRIMVIPQPNGVDEVNQETGIGYTIFGVTEQTTIEQINRASLEAVAYQMKDILDKIEKDTGIELTELVVDGQITRNGYLLQKLANLTELEIKCPILINYSSLGAAELAGLQIGIWDYMDITDVLIVKERFTPKGDIQQEEADYTQWCLAKHCVEEFVRLRK